MLGVEGVWKIVQDPMRPRGSRLHCHYTVNGKHRDFAHDFPIDATRSYDRTKEAVQALRDSLARHISEELLRGGEKVVINGLKP